MVERPHLRIGGSYPDHGRTNPAHATDIEEAGPDPAGCRLSVMP
jgi:hypothetical protein